MGSASDWPAVPEPHHWVLDSMDERLDATDLTPEELTARAEELQAEARDSAVGGYRKAALSLAQRYEQTASRLASG